MTPHPYIPIYSIAFGLTIADIVCVYAVHTFTNRLGLEIVVDVFISLLFVMLFSFVARLMRHI